MNVHEPQKAGLTSTFVHVHRNPLRGGERGCRITYIIWFQHKTCCNHMELEQPYLHVADLGGSLEFYACPIASSRHTVYTKLHKNPKWLNERPKPTKSRPNSKFPHVHRRFLQDDGIGYGSTDIIWFHHKKFCSYMELEQPYLSVADLGGWVRNSCMPHWRLIVQKPQITQWTSRPHKNSCKLRNTSTFTKILWGMKILAIAPHTSSTFHDKICCSYIEEQYSYLNVADLGGWVGNHAWPIGE